MDTRILDNLLPRERADEHTLTDGTVPSAYYLVQVMDLHGIPVSHTVNVGDERVESEQMMDAVVEEVTGEIPADEQPLVGVGLYWRKAPELVEFFTQGPVAVRDFRHDSVLVRRWSPEAGTESWQE